MKGRFKFEYNGEFTGDFLILFTTGKFNGYINKEDSNVIFESFCKVFIENNKGFIEEIYFACKIDGNEDAVFSLDIHGHGEPDYSEVDVFVNSNGNWMQYNGRLELLKVYYEILKAQKDNESKILTLTINNE